MSAAVLNPVRFGGHTFRAHASSGSRSRSHRRARSRPFSSSPSLQKAIPFSLDNGATSSTASTSVHGDGDSHLRMIMFGRPGAGKGTLSARLVKEFDVESISTGDLLRQQIAQRTDVGRQAEEIVARGDLLPDDLMLKVVTSELDNLRDKHWILDGFPRTIGQGELLDGHLRQQNIPLTLLALLAVPIELLRARIAARYIHPASGRVYNIVYNPPAVPGRDDITGEPLVQRPDDTPEVYERRLERYDAETAPLIGYYSAQARAGAKQESVSHRLGRNGGLHIVSLEGETSDIIWPDLAQTVRQLFPTLRTREELRSATQAHIGQAPVRTTRKYPPGRLMENLVETLQQVKNSESAGVSPK